MQFRTVLASAAVVLATVAPGLAEEDRGLEDLDRAVSIKLTAESLEELNAVVDHCQSALDKGLNEDRAEFANQLLASTLLQRASGITDAIFQGPPANPGALRQILTLRQLALGDLERAVTIDGDLAEAHLLLGRLHALPGGDHERARRALDEAIRTAGDSTELLVEGYGMRAQLQQDPEQKLFDLQQARKLDPQNIEVIREIVEAQITLGKQEEAEDALRKLVEVDAENPANYQALALLLAAQEKFQDARKALDKAIELAPDAAGNYLHRGRIHVAEGNHQKALEDFTASLERNGSNPLALLMRAETYARLGDLEEAEEDIEATLTLVPDFAPALKARAVLKASEEKFADAIADLEKFRQQQPGDLETLMQLGTLYRVTENAAGAVECFTAVLQIDPKNMPALRGRADTHIHVGNHVEAVKDYTAALELNDEDVLALNNLAWLLATSPEENVRDGKRALKIAEHAASLTEHRQAFILSTLAAAHAECGNFDQAKHWCRKAVELSDEELRPQIAKELESYEAGNPWREQKPAPEERTAAKPTNSK